MNLRPTTISTLPVAFLTLLLTLIWTAPLRAEISATAPAVHQDRHQLWIEAQFEYRLAPAVVDALQNGIPLVFLARYQIEEITPFWESNRLIKKVEHQFILSYREFTNRYYLISLQNQTHGIYDTLDEALQRMAIRHTALRIDKSELHPKRHYQARIRSLLDGSTLPGLIRPYLYTPLLWKEWKLDSDWQTIPFEYQIP